MPKSRRRFGESWSRSTSSWGQKSNPLKRSWRSISASSTPSAWLPDRMLWAGPEPLPEPTGQAWCETSCRYRAVFLTVIDSQAPDLCAAQGMRLFQYRVEYRREIARR